MTAMKHVIQYWNKFTTNLESQTSEKMLTDVQKHHKIREL